MQNSTIFAVIYRWRLVPGREQQFVEAWADVTRALVAERGGLGSRLHRGADGLWYAYAQWPTAEARERAFSGGEVAGESARRMREATLERLPEIPLETVADLLLPAGSAG